MHGRREFSNTYEDFVPHRENNIINITDGKIHHQFLEKIRNSTDRLLGNLEANLPLDDRDVSIYTGPTGIALLYYQLSAKVAEGYFSRAVGIAEQSLRKLRFRDITFLMGDAGPLALGAVLRSRQTHGNAQELVDRVVALLPQILNLKSDLPDEILYGRAGYLYTLLYLNKHIGPDTVRRDTIRQVVSAVLESGQAVSRQERRNVPLMYMWHQKYYIGGAHGIAGILYVLLKVVSAILQSGKTLAQHERTPVPLMYKWYGEYYVGGCHGLAGILYTLLKARDVLSENELHTLVKPTIDYLQGLRYPTNNFPSSIGSTTDRLVQWCHGAPGVVYLFTEAHKVFGDQRYMSTALECGDVVWERGLLTKGYSLCHGVAGNAYTFLHLYHVTKDLKHLHRACQFANWCFAYGRNQGRKPDRPFSMYEGLAGVIYFLVDLQNPTEARFPGFEL